MKVRLSVAQKPLSGYLNIDPMPQAQGDEGFDVMPRDIKNLEGVVDAAQCTELRGENVLDYIPSSQMGQVLTHWVSRLRHNGTIMLGGTDAMALAREYLNGNLNTIEYNMAVHGDQQTPWSIKSGQVTLFELTEILNRLGLKIVKKRLDGVVMMVEARRP